MSRKKIDPNKTVDDIIDEVEEIKKRSLENDLFDLKYTEFKDFIDKNYYTKRSDIKNELECRLKELNEISRHRLSNLLINKSLFPFLQEKIDSTTLKKLTYAKFVFEHLRKALGIKKMSSKSKRNLSQMLKWDKDKNKLISIIDWYYLKRDIFIKMDKEASITVNKIEDFLKINPEINTIVNDALEENDKIHSDALWKLHEQRENDIVNLFSLKEFERNRQIINKNPDFYMLMFPYWNDIADKFGYRYTKGKRVGQPHDTNIIKWLLKEMKQTNIHYKNKKFKTIQKHWNRYKENLK